MARKWEETFEFEHSVGQSAVVSLSSSRQTIIPGEYFAVSWEINPTGTYARKIKIDAFALSDDGLSVLFQRTEEKEFDQWYNRTHTGVFSFWFTKADYEKLDNTPKSLKLVCTVTLGVPAKEYTFEIDRIKLLSRRATPVITGVEIGEKLAHGNETALSRFGNIVQGYSEAEARVTFQLEPLDPYEYARSATLTIQGKQYEAYVHSDAIGVVGYTEYTIPLGVFDFAGENIPFTVTVENQDRDVGTFEGTVTVLPYSKPTLTAFNAVRCVEKVDDDGDTVYIPTPEGEYIALNFAGNVSPLLEKNLWSLKIDCVSGDETYTETIDNGSDGESIKPLENPLILSRTLNNQKMWELTITLVDWFTTNLGESARLTTFVMKAKFIGSMSEKGFSVGMRSTGTAAKPRVEFVPPAFCYGGIEGVTNYEDGELPTYGTWLNGKPIYRYVLVADTTVDGGIAVIGKLPSEPDTIINMRGTLLCDDGNWRPVPFAYYSSSNMSAGFYIQSTGDINIQLGSGYDNTKTAVLIVEYTRMQDEVPIYHSIVNLLTNATTNNSIETIAKGTRYFAILTANPGYEITSVSITMGNEDITSAVYANGQINIPMVTGDIFIAAVATEKVGAEFTANDDGSVTVGNVSFADQGGGIILLDGTVFVDLGNGIVQLQ